nr:hypothetical protein [Tanacetum cinerariifolium]
MFQGGKKLPDIRQRVVRVAPNSEALTLLPARKGDCGSYRPSTTTIPTKQAKLQQACHMKWMTYLQKFNLVIKYRKESQNKPADMLSHLPFIMLCLSLFMQKIDENACQLELPSYMEMYSIVNVDKLNLFELSMLDEEPGEYLPSVDELINEQEKTRLARKTCVKKVPLNNNIGKQIGDYVDMPSEAVEKKMDANVPDEIDGAKGEQVPNHVVKKGNLEFLVCKEVANPGVNEPVDKRRPLKRKKVYAE